jgi:hypothetical protein
MLTKESLLREVQSTNFPTKYLKMNNFLFSCVHVGGNEVYFFFLKFANISYIDIYFLTSSAQRFTYKENKSLLFHMGIKLLTRIMYIVS